MIKVLPGNNILVKYLGPTDTEGTRWQVQDTDKLYPAKTYTRDHAFNPTEDAARVAGQYAADVGGWRWADTWMVAWVGEDTYIVIPGRSSDA